MPTYLNNTTKTQFVDRIAIGANQIYSTKFYIDLKNSSGIIKVSDLPAINSNDTFFPVFENISGVTNLSFNYLARSRIILLVKEHSDVSPNNTIDVTIFNGDTDNQEAFTPVGIIKLTKLYQKDILGIQHSYWMPDPPCIRNSFEDSADYLHYKFGSVAVTAVSDPSIVYTLLVKLL